MEPFENKLKNRKVEATLHALDKEPASNCPRFETSFCRGGVFIFVATNPEAKAWLAKKVTNSSPGKAPT